MKLIDLKPAGTQPDGSGAPGAESNNMLQSAYWGRLKEEFGWRAFSFNYRYKLNDDILNSRLMVLVRSLGAGFSLAYVPHGPDPGLPADYAAGDGLKDCWLLTAGLARELKQYLPAGCMFIRFDPPWGLKTPAIDKKLSGYPEELLSPKIAGGEAGLFIKANMDIQPPSTVILKPDIPEEELLAGMKSKTRYNIRLAAKKGVEIRTAGIEALPEWYELYRVTAERDKIALHSLDYYRRVFELSAELSAEGSTPGSVPEIRLLQAVIEGQVEAGIITGRHGIPNVNMKATYLYGASSNNKRNYMPAYALQREAIRQAAEAGCTEYDFFGIPPVNSPDHPMYGLYRFKTGFGGEILHRPGCWDYPCKKTAYSAFRAAERARTFYYKKLRKR